MRVRTPLFHPWHGSKKDSRTTSAEGLARAIWAPRNVAVVRPDQGTIIKAQPEILNMVGPFSELRLPSQKNKPVCALDLNLVLKKKVKKKKKNPWKDGRA